MPLIAATELLACGLPLGGKAGLQHKTPWRGLRRASARAGMWTGQPSARSTYQLSWRRVYRSADFAAAHAFQTLSRP